MTHDLRPTLYLRGLLRWWWLLLLGPLVAGGISYTNNSRSPLVYQSRVRVMIGTSIQSVNPDAGSIYVSEQLAKTYVQIVRSAPVLDAVARALAIPGGASALDGAIGTSQVDDTQLIDISVTDTSPQRAAAIANAVANELIKQSPSGPSSAEAVVRAGVGDEIERLKLKLAQTDQELDALVEQILASKDDAEIARLRERRDLLQDRAGRMQSTLASLYNTFLTNQPNKISVVEPAPVPTYPIGPLTVRDAIFAALIGLVLSAGAALLLEFLDDSLESADDVRTAVELPLLGSVLRHRVPANEARRGAASQLPVAASQPLSAAAESYRVLRTNLQFSSPDRPLRLLVVTSPQPHEGKTTVSANLGVVLAQSGQRVILVDSDLRRPSLHQVFGVGNAEGLTNLLASHEEVGPEVTSLITVGVNLKLLPSGPLPPNPSELLGSRRLDQLLGVLRDQCDVVIFDSPPALSVTDAPVLARRVDGVLLVASRGGTRRSTLQRTVTALQQIGSPVLGVVLNRVNGGARYGNYSLYTSGADAGDVATQGRGLLRIFRRREAR